MEGIIPRNMHGSHICHQLIQYVDLRRTSNSSDTDMYYDGSVLTTVTSNMRLENTAQEAGLPCTDRGAKASSVEC